jgi:flagellar basal-body rod protein FlgF
MDNSNYNLLAARVGAFDKVTTISNNIANSNSPGYKKDDLTFNQYLTQDLLDKNTMPQERATIVDTSPGSIKGTERQLDLALTGDVFFALQTPLGIRYTRNGAFTINNENQLVSQSGYQVLTPNGDNITFNENDLEITIDEEGKIFARLNSQENYQERGAISLVTLDKKFLRKAGDSNFLLEEPGIAIPAETRKYKVLQGYLEESNIVPVIAMKDLIEVQNNLGQVVALGNETSAIQSNLYGILAKVR